jgi:hypothetical protein
VEIISAVYRVEYGLKQRNSSFIRIHTHRYRYRGRTAFDPSFIVLPYLFILVPLRPFQLNSFAIMFRRLSRRATDGSDAVTRDATVKNARKPTRRASKAASETSQKHVSKSSNNRLTQSLPNFARVKGIMKYVTEDESIHSKYGEESKEGNEIVAKEGNETVDSKHRVVLKDIQIREYARTIGDNPSCSSGPPIS